MDKFQNKYRIQSTRLKHWDYGWDAAYFVTICTKNREHYFGEIVDGEMKKNEIGMIVETEWLKTFDMRPDMNLKSGEFVVMPNHFHAIIIIGQNQYNTQRCRDAMHCVSTTGTTGTTGTKPKNQFGSQSKNLASIIRGFKIGVTKNARKIQPNFIWQSRFYDHIIRNEESFNKIAEYIIKNPLNWDKDKFYHGKYHLRKHL